MTVKLHGIVRYSPMRGWKDVFVVQNCGWPIFGIEGSDSLGYRERSIEFVQAAGHALIELGQVSAPAEEFGQELGSRRSRRQVGGSGYKIELSLMRVPSLASGVLKHATVVGTTFGHTCGPHVVELRTQGEGVW